MIIILMGPPASGKGTQAELISDKYIILHLSSGKIFREEVKKESSLGLKVKRYLELGSLVPDELTVQMIDHQLDQVNWSRGLVLDGFPRTVEQAKELERLLAQKNRSVDLVFNLDVPCERLVERLSARGRDDDTKETIQNRLKIHEQQSNSLLDFYQGKGVLRTINGHQDVHGVFKQIDQIIQGQL